jgi:hypothetical protein
MKSLKRLSLLIALMGSLILQANAQSEIDQYLNDKLKDNFDDGEKLIGAYVDPLMKAVSSSLNQGWYNTAAPHKMAGVDLTVSFNTMTIPKDQLLYNVDDLGLKNLALHSSSPDFATHQAPTIFGPNRTPIFYDKTNDPGAVAKFSGSPGIDLKGKIGMNAIPVPTANLGFGLPKGFDIKVRFVPELKFGTDKQSSFSMWGIGVMHDVKQWIPGIKSLPFDLSGFVGYTTLKMKSKFNAANTEDAHAVFQMNSITVQGVISKKISVLTVYGGAGYNIAKSNMSLLGKYDLNGDDDYSDSHEVDPVKLDFTASGPRMTAGFRLKLAVFTLHADYTLQKYSCFTAGFGISVR